jgi:glyoxylase-like metal-dependent hydrolase (beta-lactamase superfamily II)
MIKLAEGVHTWGYFNLEKKYNFNGFLLSGEGGIVLVDPPPLSEDDRAYFEALSLWPDLIVITNRNHLRDRQWWLDRDPVPTAMHEAEAGQVDIKVERPLKEEDTLAPGLEVVHLPGKSPGEIGLLWRARKLLLLGDALIAPQGRLRLIPDAKLDDPAGLRKSVRKLEALDFDTLLLGDGDPILRGAKAAVADFLKGLQP